MTDHPGWGSTEDGESIRAVRCDGTGVLVSSAGHALVEIRDGGIRVDRVDPGGLAGPDELLMPLKQMGVVERVANPCLWDALATAIMRQVIKAAHARDRYIRFCAAHGESVTDRGATATLFPAPDRVLALSDNDFRGLGAAFPMPVLRGAASAYLEHEREWRSADTTDLVVMLQQVPRIGPWTAKAAVADYTNDFAVYPYTDLAVRTWAARLGPDRAWPAEDAAFARTWERLAGNDLSAWTLLTLAWGINHGNRTRTPAAS